MKILVCIITAFIVVILLNFYLSQKYIYIKIIKDKIHYPSEMQQYTQLIPVGSALVPFIQYRQLPEAFYLILEDEKIQVNKVEFNSVSVNDSIKISKTNGCFFGSWNKKILK